MVVTVLVVVGVLTLPWLNPGYRALSFAITTGVTAIVLYGMAIPFGQAGIMSLGYAGLMGFGAYTAAILSRDLGMNMWQAMPVLCRRCSFVRWRCSASPRFASADTTSPLPTYVMCELLRIALTNGGKLHWLRDGARFAADRHGRRRQL